MMPLMQAGRPCPEVPACMSTIIYLLASGECFASIVPSSGRSLKYRYQLLFDVCYGESNLGSPQSPMRVGTSSQARSRFFWTVNVRMLPRRTTSGYILSKTKFPRL